MSFPKYAAYKDSGIEWLGEVPAHWRIDRLKASIETCRNGIWGEEAQEDGNDIPCVRVADFDRRKLRVELSEPTIRNVTEKERNGRVLRRGDLLLEKSGGGEKQPVGCVVLYDDMRPAVCSNFVARMVLAPGQDPSYWRYVHAAAYAVRLPIGSINQTSGIQNLDQARYFNEPVAFPPKPEQAAIATFLDRETAKIDALVEEQRRLIELLKEKRQAVISQAVTKGLDPNVPMKDSGVEWLGKVPAHWLVCTLRRVISSIEQGWSPECDAYPADDQSWGVLKAGCVNHGVFNPAENKSLPQTLTPVPEYEVHSGDILVSRASGSPELVGSAALVGETRSKLMLSDKIFRVHLTLHMVNAFFVWAMNGKALRDQIERALSGGNGLANNLPQSAMLAFLVAVPPIDEQQLIASAVEHSVRKCDALIAQAACAVDLLLERRSALISAAVTGKIDVRGLVPEPESVAA
ncbi:MAG: hypothetical protein RBS46_10620 [Methyloversatilis sp.]|jgi:type I restriction enzyme S subunit|nr:hypothetical protein [Methyloversatilis sp.]